MAFDDTRVLGLIVSPQLRSWLLLAIVSDARRSKRRRKALTEVVSALNRAADLDSIMFALANQLSLPEPWRMSLFEIEGGDWVKLARSSNFPLYAEAAIFCGSEQTADVLDGHSDLGDVTSCPPFGSCHGLQKDCRMQQFEDCSNRMCNRGLCAQVVRCRDLPHSVRNAWGQIWVYLLKRINRAGPI